MTDLLLRLFTGDCDPSSPAYRTRVGFLASITCIVCNIVLCSAKAAIGLISGSVSIVADAVNNLSDASSNIVSLIGFKLASKPADESHPYGHGRFEYLAGLAVAVIVCALGLNLIVESAAKLMDPEPSQLSAALVVVLLASMAVKLWMMFFNRSLGHLIDSETLIATAADSRNDVITTGAVLTCSVIEGLTGASLDGCAGAAVGIFVIISGVSLIRDTVSPLLGQMPSPELISKIQEKILSYPGVLGTHDLMVHDYGPGRQFASAHVEMAGEADPFVAHDTLDNIEQDFKRSMGLTMTLHYDPIVTDDPEVQDMRHWVDLHVREIDPRLSIHDLRCVPGPTHTNVIFDCVRPHDLAMTDAELKGRIQATVSERWPKAVCVVNIDSSYVSSAQ